jgi:hypothetical protein
MSYRPATALSVLRITVEPMSGADVRHCKEHLCDAEALGRDYIPHATKAASAPAGSSLMRFSLLNHFTVPLLCAMVAVSFRCRHPAGAVLTGSLTD